jgi:hypothetical protein
MTALGRVFFDVDGTLITWDRRQRPYARAVVAAVATRGFEVHIWSGVGRRWEVVDVLGLRPFVAGCHEKPLSRHHERLPALGIHAAPDHVVDDDEEIVAVFGGTHVPEPLEPLHADRHLLRVLANLERRYNLRPGFDHSLLEQRP